MVCVTLAGNPTSNFASMHFLGFGYRGATSALDVYERVSLIRTMPTDVIHADERILLGRLPMVERELD
jgi:hypothetical protein